MATILKSHKLILLLFLNLLFCSSCVEQCDDDINDGYNSRVGFIYFRISGSPGLAYYNAKVLENYYSYNDPIYYNSYYSFYYYPFEPTNHFILSGPAGDDTIMLSDINYEVANQSVCGVSISVNKPTLNHTFDSLKIKHNSFNNVYELTVYTP